MEKQKMSMYQMAGLDEKTVLAVKSKILNSEKFNFTTTELDLIRKLSGLDFLTASELRSSVILFAEKLKNEIQNGK